MLTQSVMDGLVPGAEVYLCADPVQDWVWKWVLCDVIHVLRKLRSSELWILDFGVRNVCSVAHMPSPKTVPKRATLATGSMCHPPLPTSVFLLYTSTSCHCTLANQSPRSLCLELSVPGYIQLTSELRRRSSGSVLPLGT